MRLLVATDGSPHAHRAVALVARLVGETQDAEVIVIHVVHIPTLAYAAAAEFGALEDALETAAQGYLADAAQELAPARARVTTLLRNGDPANELVQAARDTHADLIVLGCRGRGRVKGLILGSVSEHVLHAATVPVLIVH